MPRSCKRVKNTGSWFDIVFKISKGFKAVNMENYNCNNKAILDKSKSIRNNREMYFNVEIDGFVVFLR